MSVGEKIRILLRRRNMTIKALAERIGESRQNLTAKLNRDNLTESEIKKIAAALNCTYDISFTMKDTGEVI